MGDIVSKQKPLGDLGEGQLFCLSYLSCCYIGIDFNAIHVTVYMSR